MTSLDAYLSREDFPLREELTDEFDEFNRRLPLGVEAHLSFLGLGEYEIAVLRERATDEAGWDALADFGTVDEFGTWVSTLDGLDDDELAAEFEEMADKMTEQTMARYSRRYNRTEERELVSA